MLSSFCEVIAMVKGDVLIALRELKIGQGVVIPKGARCIVESTPTTEDNYDFGYSLKCDFVLGFLSVSIDMVVDDFVKEGYEKVEEKLEDEQMFNEPVFNEGDIVELLENIRASNSAAVPAGTVFIVQEVLQSPPHKSSGYYLRFKDNPKKHLRVRGNMLNKSFRKIKEQTDGTYSR